MATPDAELDATVRAQWPRILAWLMRTIGDWDLAEDCAQDAVERALRTWPRDGVPDNPGAWLTAVARRRALDVLRRRATESRALQACTAQAQAEAPTLDAGGGFADDRPSDAQKVAFMHEVLQRDVTEVRMFLDHLERYTAALGPQRRAVPEVAAALASIERDRSARDRYLEFARDADESTVQARMMSLARQLGWLTPAQEQAEFLRMVSDRMARGSLGKTEVDLVCTTYQEREPGLARQVMATGAVRAGNVAHSAVLACLGSPQAHEETVRALTSSRDEDVATVQVYLRHRSLADIGELRAVASGIGRMTAPAAQVRALETLAKQRLADVQSLQEIARLFPLARSLEVQRAIAGILIRSDTKMLARADLARSLRQHRLKSPDGSDVIDMLIRVLQST